MRSHARVHAPGGTSLTGRRRVWRAGSNFAPTYDYWASEYKRTYQAKSYKQSFNAKAMGRRSEEMLFVG